MALTGNRSTPRDASTYTRKGWVTKRRSGLRSTWRASASACVRMWQAPDTNMCPSAPLATWAHKLAESTLYVRGLAGR